MTHVNLFLNGTSSVTLSMITVNSLNEIVDFNENCLANVGRADIGLEVEIRPLVNSKQKSFPYTAVLTLKGREYLACVSLANPRSTEYKNIYFSDTTPSSPDALLTSRFIIEQKCTELHARTPFTSDGDAVLKKLQKLTMLSRASNGEKKNDISLEQIVEYTVESYKKRFENEKDKTLCFCVSDGIPCDENIVSLAVSLAMLGMALSDKASDFTAYKTPMQYVFELVLRDKKFTGDISNVGFSGMFLSRISVLNRWDTELIYNAPKNESVIRIFVPISSASHRFSAETYSFDIMAYTELLTDAFLL